MPRFSTARFDNLPEDKANRVLAAAIREFADHGYEHANTNRIAAAAGISVGALFKYFATKEDLFRHVVARGAQVIEVSVRDLVAAPGPVIGVIRELLTMAIDTAQVQREYTRLYHEITATGNRELVHDLALQLEGFTAGTYTEMLRAAQEAGEVRADIPPETLAFTIDNLLMGLQLAGATDYYADRLDIYAPGLDKRQLIEQTLAFIESALTREAVQ